MTTPKEIEEKATAYARSITADPLLQLKFKLAYLQGYTQSWLNNATLNSSQWSEAQELINKLKGNQYYETNSSED